MSLRDELTSIYSARGELTPRVLVEEALPATSPLHSRFEWDDAVAGPKYREVQAAQLIRSVHLIYSKDERGREREVRAFLPVRAEDSLTASYVPTETALSNPFTMQLLLRQCKHEIEALRAKYGHLQDFADLLHQAASA